MSPRSHASNENPGVGCHPLHANAIAQKRTASERTRWIDGNDPHSHSACAIKGGKLVDESAFAGAGRAGNANYERFAGVIEDLPEKICRPGARVFDSAYGPSDRTLIAGKNLF
jgi:hypothetical protein